MSTELTKEITATQQEIITSLVLNGDLSKMQPAQKVEYYNNFCRSLGLNPLTQPFEIIKFQGKEKMYAKKDCTDQLRKIYGISITDLKSEIIAGNLYKVVVTARALDGRIDAATGVLSIEGLKGEALSNAIMKAESKAKRRVTLSICGLGILDETELDSVRNAQPMPDATTVQTIDTEYEEIDISDIPNEVVEQIKSAPTKKDLKDIFENNADLKELPNFIQLLKKRQADLELQAAQQKYGTDGSK